MMKASSSSLLAHLSVLLLLHLLLLIDPKSLCSAELIRGSADASTAATINKVHDEGKRRNLQFDDPEEDNILQFDNDNNLVEEDADNNNDAILEINYIGEDIVGEASLKLCEGDCDTDNDCQGTNTICFQRSENEAVPGCVGGEFDNSKADYCILKTPSGQQQQELEILDFGEKLGFCQGFCSEDEDCDGELICHLHPFNNDNSQTTTTTTTTFQGCDLETFLASQVMSSISRQGAGGAIRFCAYNDDADDPDPAPAPAPTPAPTPTMKQIEIVCISDCNRLQKCQGDCDNDNECGFGLECYFRTGRENVPGCQGGSQETSNMDYCYDPNDVVIDDTSTATTPSSTTATMRPNNPRPTPRPTRLQIIATPKPTTTTRPTPRPTPRPSLRPTPRPSAAATTTTTTTTPTTRRPNPVPTSRPTPRPSAAAATTPTTPIPTSRPTLRPTRTPRPTPRPSPRPTRTPRPSPRPTPRPTLPTTPGPTPWPTPQAASEPQIIPLPPTRPQQQQQQQQQFLAIHVGENTPFLLDRCQADCDRDQDCEPGLVCFQRRRGEAIPGCFATNLWLRQHPQMDFCIQQPGSSATVGGTAQQPQSQQSQQQIELQWPTFNLRLYWEDGYEWQEETTEFFFCMEHGLGWNLPPRCWDSEFEHLWRNWCGNRDDDWCWYGAENQKPCEPNRMYTAECDIRNPNQRFTFDYLESGEVQIRAVSRNLCFKSGRPQLVDCDPTDKSQRWMSGTTSFADDKFEISRIDDYPDDCLTNHHHPKPKEIIELKNCTRERRDDTSYWTMYNG